MSRQLLKGNEAVVKGALLAGCRAFYGYPITPATEILEAAAWYFPRAGGVFLQAESEIAAIHMVYGAASAGQRAMTASSGPGISLMSEALSYLAGAELPCVIVDITRAGPGLGNIAPEQSDYWQVVRNGGHGCYRSLVLAPASVQEMADLTRLAFELADRYRNPVFVLADGTIGQMMEPVEFSEPAVPPRMPQWAVDATAATRRNLISSIYLENDDLEAHILKLQTKYELARDEVRFDHYRTADASVILVGYGIVARILRHTVDELRARGIPAGLLRPITLFPFPNEELRRLANTASQFVAVEMSCGQMVEDVRLAVNGAAEVVHYGRYGGNLPDAHEITAFVQGRVRKEAVAYV